jgi:glycosyltransferase involved in cell wall biosynthesis
MWYRAADVFVCTSRWESMSLCVLEAMSCGLPVVTFSEVGASRFVTDGGGRVIRLLDVEGFSRAIFEYLSAPELRATCGEIARQRVRLEFGEGRLPPAWQPLLDRLSQ